MVGCVACTPRCWVCGDETWFGVACGKLVVFEFFVWSRVGVGMACLAEGRVSESVNYYYENMCIECFGTEAHAVSASSCHECRKQPDCCYVLMALRRHILMSRLLLVFRSDNHVLLSQTPQLRKHASQGETLSILVPRRVLLPAHGVANPHRPGRQFSPKRGPIANLQA